MSEPELPRSWWRRIRTRLSLRVLMVIVLVIGGGLGWVVHRAKVQRQAVEAITKAGGTVSYDWQYPDGKLAPKGATSPWPKPLVDALGPDYFDSVAGVMFRPGRKQDSDSATTDALMAQIGQLDRTWFLHLVGAQGEKVTDAGLAHVAGLTRLKVLVIRGRGLTDSGLVHLAGLSRLETLTLNFTPMTDAGMAHFRGLTRLKSLDLRMNPGIRGPGLVHLANMTQLEHLALEQTSVDGAGLAHLASLRSLRELILSGPGITDDGLAHLEGLENLTLLTISNAPITSTGLTHLKGL